MFVLVKLLQILHLKGIFKARSEGLQSSLERIPALLMKHKAMEGTTRKMKMFNTKVLDLQLQFGLGPAANCFGQCGGVGRLLCCPPPCCAAGMPSYAWEGGTEFAGLCTHLVTQAGTFLGTKHCPDVLLSL